MEMNTRLQVEHPVTEQVHGVDLVEVQLRIAAGEPLPWSQDDLVPRGHAVEARVYAEDPARGFLPTGGTVLRLREPAGRGIRVDSGIGEGDVVGTDYDPMLAKVVAHGDDRRQAIARLDAALAATTILGVTTNLAMLRAVLADPDVVAGRLDTGLVERRHGAGTGGAPGADDDGDRDAALALAAVLALPPPEPASPWADGTGWRHGGPAPVALRLRPGHDDPVDVVVRAGSAGWEVAVGTGPPAALAVSWVDGDALVRHGTRSARFAVAHDGATTWLGCDGRTWSFRRAEPERPRGRGRRSGDGTIRSPMPGQLLAVHVRVGDAVAAGQPLAIVEAMKMEHALAAPAAGVVTAVHAAVGDQLLLDQPVLTVGPDQPDQEGRPA
jgi:acetyl-CoA/propionyl-CoA carboxylase biotin carboxyl carrier protein